MTTTTKPETTASETPTQTVIPEVAAVVSPLANAENSVKTVERSVTKAFKTFVGTPSLTNRKALNDALDAAGKAPALDTYRTEFVKANFS